MKKRIFIGSSNESLTVAKTVQIFFNTEYETVIWNEGFFEQNQNTYTQLCKKASAFDYAIFIGGKDDKVFRLDGSGRTKIAPRDNVYLEFGLYAGILSPACTFFLIDKACNLASDLFGITIEKYANKDEIISACSKFRTAIEKLNRQSRITLLPSTSLAIGYYNNYIDMLSKKIYKCNELHYHDKTIDIRKKEKHFSIVIPNDCNIDIHTFVLEEFPAEIFPLITLKDNVKPHYVRLDVKRFEEKNEIRFIDVPLTLDSAYEAVDLLSGVDFIGDDENIKYMKNREIENFVNTLENLIKKNAIIKPILSIERI